MSVLLLERDTGLVTRPVRWWDVVEAHALAHRLDTALAGGRAPEDSAALAVRAQWLTSARVRYEVTEQLQRIHDAATGSRARPTGTVAVQWDAVRACAADLTALIDAVRAPGPVAARGMAMALLLLTDGTGPLYYGLGGGSLSGALREATTALRLDFDR